MLNSVKKMCKHGLTLVSGMAFVLSALCQNLKESAMNK